jgi:hypothetical protein
MTPTHRGARDGEAGMPCQRPVLVLVGEDGNAFSILGRARQALRLAGRSDEWEAFAAEATSGDYDRLLATVMDWFEVE